jgi:hypothetical protein
MSKLRIHAIMRTPMIAERKILRLKKTIIGVDLEYILSTEIETV